VYLEDWKPQQRGRSEGKDIEHDQIYGFMGIYDFNEEDYKLAYVAPSLRLAITVAMRLRVKRRSDQYLISDYRAA
jgi:hypothetical protein